MMTYRLCFCKIWMLLNDSPFCTEVLMQRDSVLIPLFSVFFPPECLEHSRATQEGDIHCFFYFIPFVASTILLSFHHFIHPTHSAYHTFVCVLLSVSQFISPSPLSITQRIKRSSLHRRLTYKIIGRNRRINLKKCK